MWTRTGRPRNKRQKVTLYDQSWEQLPDFRDWLEKSENEGNARCKYCNKDIPIYLTGVDALRRHEQTRFHHYRVPIYYGPKPLVDYVNEAKELLEGVLKKYKWRKQTMNCFLQSMANFMPESEIAQELVVRMSLPTANDLEHSDDSN